MGLNQCFLRYFKLTLIIQFLFCLQQQGLKTLITANQQKRQQLGRMSVSQIVSSNNKPFIQYSFLEHIKQQTVLSIFENSDEKVVSYPPCTNWDD